MAEVAKPLPRVSEELAPFFAAARRRELVVQRCDDCGTLRFPARELCASCLSRRATWVPVSGRGRVLSFYVMHQVYHPAFAAEVPYAVAVVELEEGPRLTTNLVDCALGEIRVDLPVEVTFQDRSPEVSLPVFRPIRAG
jgi:uncharacterized OB-fold protein